MAVDGGRVRESGSVFWRLLKVLGGWRCWIGVSREVVSGGCLTTLLAAE